MTDYHPGLDGVIATESSISDIRNGGSEAQIKRLEKELQRLNAIGGFEKLVPNEGLVFFYKGNTYKLTGTFAPLKTSTNAFALLITSC